MGCFDDERMALVFRSAFHHVNNLVGLFPKNIHNFSHVFNQLNTFGALHGITE